MVLTSFSIYVLCRGSTYKPKWASHTVGRGVSPHHVKLQHDGNLVLYDADGEKIWHSGTIGKAVTDLTMQDDGNLVIYTNQSHAHTDAVWSIWWANKSEQFQQELQASR
jgi:hypothetical protein